jgi:hypothetical protein
MVLKGLALGGAIAAVAIAVFAALTLRAGPPAPAVVTDPAGVNMVVLPNGLAAPQLQPAQPGSAPALVNDASPASLVGTAGDTAGSSAVKLDAAESSAASATEATEAKALKSCAGD